MSKYIIGFILLCLLFYFHALFWYWFGFKEAEQRANLREDNNSES